MTSRKVDGYSHEYCEMCKYFHIEVQEGGGWLEICEVTCEQLIWRYGGLIKSDRCPFKEVKMCKWIPVKHSYVCGADTIVSDLPKDGEIVFITIRGGKVEYDVFERISNARWKFKHFDIKDVEAWMRFPKPYHPGDRSCLWVPIGHNPLRCPILPEDGEQVLITVRGGYVLIDTFETYDSGNVDFYSTLIEFVTAWTKFPAPYVPRSCGNCRYSMTEHDDDGFRWTDCQLIGDGVFSNTKPVDCPLKKEV